MGRPKRIQFPGACYYIVLRGNNRQDIFLSNQDRRQFLSLLRGYKERHGLKVYAYCLMSRDAHLLVETPSPNLSLIMQGFNTVYTKFFNSQHDAVGHVFQGRYQALLVEPEAYLAEMTRFIHLQPVRAGLKEKPWRYQWSSCSAYIESELKEPLVDSEAVLGQFAKARLKQSVRYLQYIKDKMKSVAEFELPILRGMVIGGEAFLAKVEASAPDSGSSPAASMDQARRILAEVAAKHSMEEERLLGRVQWRDVSSVRRKAVYRIWKESGMGVSQISRLFHRTPSAISQMIRSMEAAAGISP